jgi:hypothetical protein
MGPLPIGQKALLACSPKVPKQGHELGLVFALELNQNKPFIHT